MEFRLVLFRSGRAVGISGKDANFVTASKVQRTTRDPGSLIEQAVDLGFVGEPSKVDRSLLDTLSAAGMIPVVAPIGVGTDGATYNINARSEERRVGKECVSKGRSRWSPYHLKKKKQKKDKRRS